MTLREIQYRVLDIYRSAHKGADDITPRHIVSFIESSRSKFLKQRFDKPMVTADETNTQTLTNEAFTLIKSNTNSLVVDGIALSDLGRDLLVSTRPIPKTISRSGHMGTWVRVSPTDMLNVRITMTNMERAISGGYGKFNYSELFGFEYQNSDNKNYVYVTSRNPTILESISTLNLRGVFESPLAVMAMNNPTLEEEDLWDLEYPIGVDIIDDIEQYIKETKISIPLQAESKEYPKE